MVGWVGSDPDGIRTMAANTITATDLSGSDVLLDDIGTTVPANGSVVLTDFLHGFEIINSISLRSAISAGDVELDIGSGALSQNDALDMLSSAPVAGGISFDNSTVGFTSTTVQGALDEVVTSTPARIDVYDSNGGQTFTTGLIVVDMDVTRQSIGGVLTLQPNGSVLHNSTGARDYDVTYDVTLGIASGTARSNTEAFLYVNGVVVPGTRRACYNRTAGNDESSATGRAFLTLNPGDVVDVRVRRFTGSDTMVTVQSSSLSLVEFRGSQGAPGVTGPPGPAGSGSNINVANSSVLLPGGPFSVLNFTNGLLAADAGGGQVDIQLIAGSGVGTSFPLTPFDGQLFYRTDLQWEFRWDGTRGKWLGTTVEFEGGGFNGTVNNGYLRRFNGMTTSATLGTQIPYDITIVGLSGRWSNSLTGTLQLRRDGVAVSSVSYVGAANVGNMTLNDDFAANANMSFYVVGSHSAPQVRVWYRRHAT